MCLSPWACFRIFFFLNHRTWIHEGTRIHKVLCNLRQEGVRESVLTDVFRDPGEVGSSLYYFNVNTTSTLPKLSMSEGPVSRGSPNYIKGRLNSNSPICLSALFKLGVTFQPSPVWPQQGITCVWMQFAVLEYACSPAPAWNPDQFALTCNILGAIRTPPELLDASSDPCGFMWGDRMQTHYNPLYLPETCPVTQFQMELSWVHPSWVFCVETGWNEETLVDHVVTCLQTQGHNHLNPVMWHACVCV